MADNLLQVLDVIFARQFECRFVKNFDSSIRVVGFGCSAGPFSQAAAARYHLLNLYG